MGNLKAVIFDMDGVLIDSEPIHYAIERIIFDKLGINVSAEIHSSYLGTAGDFMYTDLKSRFGLSATITELLERDEAFRCDYFKNLPGIHLNEGALTLLHEIKRAGLSLAVATSSSPGMARILLDRCEVFSIFDAVVTTEEAGKSKPAPDVYLLAAQKIGAEPENCIVFEDSPNGIRAAKSAGMVCVAIQTDSVGVHELSHADDLIGTFREVTTDRLLEIFSRAQVPG